VLCLEDRCQPSTGVLDPTFGSGGQVAAAVPAAAVLVQPWDSRIVVAGSTSGMMALARYNTDGSLDTSFDGDGIFVSNVSGSLAAAAQYSKTGSANDGKIVSVAGTTVARFNAAGGLDTAFGKQGKATLPWTGSVSVGGVVVQGDGKVVVSGMEGTSNNRTLKVTRLNVNGSVDTSFATKGTWETSAVVSVGPPPIYRAPLALQPDGKILVSRPYGWLTPGFGWMQSRLTSAGAVDATFTVTTTTFGTAWNQPNGAARPTGLAVYPASDAVNAGKILAVGFTHSAGGSTGGATVLARYHANGGFDASFGVGGKLITPAGGTSYGVAIQADGKAIVAGTTLQRYNTDGSLDTTFGSGGFVQTQYAGLAIQPDGRIDVANSTAVARYLAEQPRIGSLIADANPFTSGSSATLTASNVTTGNPGASITQVAFYYFDAGGAKQLLGYGTQTSPGVWSLTFTVGFASGTYNVFAEATDSFGVTGDPASLTLHVV